MSVELIRKYIPIAFADPLALFLVQKEFFSQEEISKSVDKALSAQLSLVAFLINQPKTNCKILGQAVADYLHLEFFDLSDFSGQDFLRDIVDAELIRVYGVLPLLIKDQQIYLAISEPRHLEILPELKFHTDLLIKPVVVAGDKLCRLIEDYISEHNYLSLSHFNFSVEKYSPNDQRVTEFVKQILTDAVHKRASDIHLEPYTTSYRIRLRIDGILHKMTLFSLEVANRLVASIKVMANLDISERRFPQDGRFSIEVSPQTIRDCRVSTCPTLYGEKIVIRLLAAESASPRLEELGMEEAQYQQFTTAIQRPQGMILVTGPTGSGKTITLYSALQSLNTLDKNIVTAEEPVEMKLAGINQVSVNSKIDLGFSKILKAFLRQDPDVLMIGEIRDKETADISLKAAQTGHLVLSTLHANSAADTLLRLLMMDISAFNIAHSIHLIVAQRLLRKLCQYCKRSRLISCVELQNLGFSKEKDDSEIFEEVGCEKCNKGYIGRVAVFEMLPIMGEVMQLMLNMTNSKEIAKFAEEAGYINLYRAAMNKVYLGLTSLSEVQRVIL